jgi:hypothetical protein
MEKFDNFCLQKWIFAVFSTVLAVWPWHRICSPYFRLDCLTFFYFHMKWVFRVGNYANKKCPISMVKLDNLTNQQHYNSDFCKVAWLLRCKVVLLLGCKVAWLLWCKIALMLRCKVAWLLRCIARLRYSCITMLRYCCVARLCDCCVARLRKCSVACKVAWLLRCKVTRLRNAEN